MYLLLLLLSHFSHVPLCVTPHLLSKYIIIYIIHIISLGYSLSKLSSSSIEASTAAVDRLPVAAIAGSTPPRRRVCCHDLSPLDVSDTEAPHLHCGRTDLQECQEPDRAGQPVCCCQWREWRWKGKRASFPPWQLHDCLDGQTGWAGAPGSVTPGVSMQCWVGPGQEVRSQGF